MSHYFMDDECNECIQYVKEISDTGEWQCVLCGIYEIEIILQHDKLLWTRYLLQCGHEAHTRCYRKWCKQNNTVGCNVCGFLDKKEENMYCNICDVGGHQCNKK